MRIIKVLDDELGLRHMIAGYKDADELKERFPYLRRDIINKFCDYMKEHRLIVGIIEVYNKPYHWYGAHFYVGRRDEKYSERPDLSVNGFRLKNQQLIDYMNGKKHENWYRLADNKK